MTPFDLRRPHRMAHLYVTIDAEVYALEPRGNTMVWQKLTGDKSQQVVSFPPGEDPWCSCPAFYKEPPCKHVLTLLSLQNTLNGYTGKTSAATSCN